MAKKLQNPEKKKAWDGFSQYRRRKRCIETTGLAMVGICVTCDKQFHFSYLDCGHFIGGRSNAILLCEKFTDIQCQYCNQALHGKPKKYRKVMVQRYGEEYITRWENKLKHQILLQDKQINWVGRRERYKRKLDKLEVYKEIVS